MAYMGYAVFYIMEKCILLYNNARRKEAASRLFVPSSNLSLRKFFAHFNIGAFAIWEYFAVPHSHDIWSCHLSH